MPDSFIEVAFIFSDNAHADMGYKIIRDRGEHTDEDIRSITVTLALQVSFSQQTVRVDLFWVEPENVAAVCNRLIELMGFDQLFNIPLVGS
jgi:hypothetical protein